MKVLTSAPSQPGIRARVSIVLTLAIILLFSASVSSAGAITRSEVLKRATSWVKRRVPYSQRGYFQGYRRDCSGFVSMAWKLNTSYSSRTISAKARRISISSLRPGDAVLRPGHVAIFGGWKNKSRREYIAIEQTTWGSHAKRHVRRIPRRAIALRRRGITDPRRVVRVAARPKPKPAAKRRLPITAIVPIASALPSSTPSVVAASLVETVAPLPAYGLATVAAADSLTSTIMVPTLVPQP